MRWWLAIKLISLSVLVDPNALRLQLWKACDDSATTAYIRREVDEGQWMALQMECIERYPVPDKSNR